MRETSGAPMLTPSDMLALPQPAGGVVVSYGELPSQRGELRVPVGASRAPLAVLLHGGCWESAVDRAHLSRFAEALRARGVASWNVEFRRVGEEGGGWPGTFDDVRSALALAPSLAEAHGVDPSRVILLGHSAGAHLALWYASAEPLARSLRAVFALAPITELARELLRGPCKRAASALVAGAGLDDHASREACSPARMPPPRCPVALVEAAGDAVVAPLHGERYLAAHGSRCERRVLPDCGHFELIVPGEPACEAVLALVASRLRASAG